MEYNEDEGDYSGNSSKEKFYKWGKEDIVILLQYYEDFVRNSVFSKRKLLWITLSKQLQEHGVPVDAVQCENKWKALCRAYRNQYKSFQYRETIERILSLNNTDNSLLTLEKESSVPVKRIKAEYDNSIDISDEFEEKTQCKLWTPQEVEVLLKVMEANIPVFCKYSKKIIYEKVAHQLKMYKITVNALNIEHKWKGLIRALRRRITQKQKKTEIDLRVEKLHKIMLAYENSTDENSPEQEINEEMPNEGNTYHTLTNSKSSGSGIMTLLRSSSEIVTAFPLEQEYNQQDYLDENLSMESIQTEPQQPRTEIIDENMTFEERLLRFLKEQEDAKQRRHDEKMELKRKKIGLLEALVQSQNKD
uniref:CSON011103 protein n=1 Tax=Culicoides sonorensis TaxID=179676 RepID=A0A336LQS7_CULSO